MTGARGSRPFVTAEIIAVGSEMLTPHRTETNSLLVTARLDEYGIRVVAKAVVGDDPVVLGRVFEQARARADLVVLIGGLGPTADDVTREVVAGVLGRPLVEDASILDGIRRRFEARGLRMPEINRRQAMVMAGAVVLPNRNGTAPGQWLDEGDRGVLLLPGPPRELEPMLGAFAQEVLASRGALGRVFRRVLKLTGWTESHVEEVAEPIYRRWLADVPPVETTILATPGQIELHLSVRSHDALAAAARLDWCVAALEPILHPAVFSTDGRTLEQVVGDLLRARRWTIAVAESCTGGLIASRLTDVSGSSAYVEEAVVAYSNRAKVDRLGVSEADLAAHGAVSESVALAMARGVRARGRADIGVGVTGIAGPTGATPGKPVGTVVVAVVGPGSAARVDTFRFGGDRSVVKAQAAQAALNLVRLVVEGVGGA